MASLIPQKGEAGKFFVPHLNKYIQIVEWREDDKYDTIVVPTGATTAGLTRNYFRDLTNKELQDTNFSTVRRLPAGEEMILDRVGLHVPTAFGDTLVDSDNLRKVVESAYFSMTINKLPVCEGPAVKFPSGYGLGGTSTDGSTNALSIGVPSTAAAAKLLREQYLTKDHDIDASLQWFDRTWDATNMATLTQKVQIKCYLHGLVKAAATKG